MAVGMEAIFARPPTSAGVCESADVDAGDGPADHQLLDLLGALEEVGDPERTFVDVPKRPLIRDDVPGTTPDSDGPPTARAANPFLHQVHGVGADNGDGLEPERPS